MRQAIAFLASMVAVVFLPLAAGAQDAAASPPQAPGLSVGLTAVGTYDTNVARISAAAAAREGLKLQDEVFSPALNVDFLKPIGAGDAYLQGSAGYDFYDRNTILNRERINLDGGFDARVGPCKGNLTAGYNRHQSNLEDVTIGIVRNTVDNESIDFDGSCPSEIGFGPTLSVSEDVMDNSNPLQIPSNFDAFKVSAGIAYTRPTFGELSLYGQYGDTSFPERLIPVGAGLERDGYQLYAGGVRYDRRLGARIEGVFSVAYSSLAPDVAGEPKFSGPTYSGDVTFRVTGKITAHAHAERALEPAIQLGTTYTIKQDYLAEVTYTMSSRLTATIGESSTIQDYKGAALVSSIDLTREAINDFYGSASLSVGRRLVLVLDLRQEDRSASPSIYNYNSTRVSLSANAKF